jgi:hypothetical protein
MSAAATFSSRYLRRLVSGIGTRSSPCASTHAKASCPGLPPPPPRNRPDPGYQHLTPVEALSGKSRISLGAGIGAAQIFRFGNRTRQKSASQRAVGHKTDPEFANGRQNLVLHVPRVVGLERRNRADLVRPAEWSPEMPPRAPDTRPCPPPPAPPFAPTLTSIGVSGSTRC